MKKRALSLFLVLTLTASLFSFSPFTASAASVADYTVCGLDEDFEDSKVGSEGWLKDYSHIDEDEQTGNNYMSFDSSANEVHYVHNVTKVSGSVTVEVDYYNNLAQSKSFFIGLNGNNGLLYVTANGGLRQGAANGWSTFTTLDLQTWYTFRLILDTDTATYSMWYKKASDPEFTQVTKNFVNNYYAASNPFKDGINLIRMSVHGTSDGSVATDKMRLDNIKIYGVPHAYTKISSAASADEMVEILNAYASEGYLSLPENYEQIIGKEAIYASLKSKTLTSDAELEEIILGLVAGETIYVDMTPYYSADIIAKRGEASDSAVFGVGSKFVLDRADMKRDGYNGQGYDGDALSALCNSEGVITLSRTGFDPVKVKIPRSVMSLGVNDTAIVTASTTKTTFEDLGDRYHKGTTVVVDEFTGRKLSTVDVACFATTVNHVWLYADVTYADGTTVSYMDNSLLPHLNKLFGSACWRSAGIGKAVQLTDGVITDAVATTDLNTTDNVTPEDNYSNTYISSQRFNLDPDKVIEKFELYNSSKWGSSSVAILGVTGIPSAKTFTLDSESYDFESNSDGFSGGIVAASPTASWDSVYKTSFGETSKLIFANDVKKYLAGDFAIYVGSDVSVKFAGTNTEVFAISSGAVSNDGKCDPALCQNASGRWIDVRFAIDGNNLVTYIKDGESYFKINSQSIPSSASGLEFTASGADAYVDDIELSTLADLHKCINDISSPSLLKSVLEIIADYGLIKLPVSLDELGEDNVEALTDVLSEGGYESDAEVKADIENAVVAYMSQNTSDELFIYDYEREYNASDLSGVSLVINKDIITDGAVIYGAAYTNGELTHIITENVSGSFAKGTKIDISDALNIDGADGYKFIFTESDSLTPLCKNIDVTINSSNVNSNYYPGWVRKTITFSYDDGNYATDEKAIALINAAGMKATFNLYSFYSNSVVKSKGKEALIALYDGHEIASHSKWHTAAIPSDHDYLNMDAYQDASASYGGQTGIYYYYANYPDLTSKQPRADDETYKKGITEGKKDLEKIFGEGSIRGFAYAYSRGSAYKDELRDCVMENHDYARDSGNVAARTGFALPSDWSNWNSTAYYNDLITNAEKFAALPDDGSLKFFCAGVHTADFNKNPNDGVNESYWYQLEDFCSIYGNNPETYWYATNIEIYDYVNALEALEITEEGIKNNSSVDVYVTIDGKKAVIKAHSIFR